MWLLFWGADYLKANTVNLNMTNGSRQFSGFSDACGNVWLSARLSEAPLYCNDGVYLCVVPNTLMSE